MYFVKGISFLFLFTGVHTQYILINMLTNEGGSRASEKNAFIIDWGHMDYYGISFVFYAQYFVPFGFIPTFLCIVVDSFFTINMNYNRPYFLSFLKLKKG